MSLEAAGFDFELVRSDRQVGKAVLALRIRAHHAGELRIRLGYADLGAGNHGRRRIGHAAR